MGCLPLQTTLLAGTTPLGITNARLTALGYQVGQRILSLLLLRQAQSNSMKDPRREHRLIPILQFVHTQVYKYAFGRPADGLERSVEGEDECR